MGVFRYKDKIVMGHNNLAELVDYDNNASQLDSKNVQGAVDELASSVNKINSELNDNTIYFNEDDNHFYITNGSVTKKLGSGEGTATASQVLVGSTFTSSKVEDVTQGTMPNNGTVIETLDTVHSSTFIAKGYHNGYGNISIIKQEKTVNSSLVEQEIFPDIGKVLSKITINKVDTSLPDAENIKTGDTILISSNDIELVKVTGTMNDYENTSVEASSLHYENSLLYYSIENRGVYNSSSKVFASLESIKSAMNAYTATLSGNTLTLS